jgi:histidine ammonia-lyase/tyrosine ammonia-lyase
MITITGEGLTLEQVRRVAVDFEAIEIPAERMEAVAAAHARVQEWGVQQRPVYGVNTGFGENARVRVPAKYRTQLQENLLRGHAAGSGNALPQAVTRAIALARINSLTKGYSGVSTETLHLMVDLLNAGVHPVIYEQGSLGASGDLSPLSHLALPVIGDGQVEYKGEILDSAVVLDRLGLKPVVLGFKEGLALINGTSAMTGMLSVLISDAYALVESELQLSGVVTQVLRGSDRAFDAIGHELKGHPGQIRVAETMRRLIAGSDLIMNHTELMSAIEERAAEGAVASTGVLIQSAYSVRCTPQILGPVLDTLDYCRTVVERELNSCNDNPLILDSADAAFHGGNFHGQYVSMAADFLAISMVEVGVLAERQVNRLVDPNLNGELPDFLALKESGLSMGLMGAQYLATSVASENLDLATPSSVKSIPSNGQNQDVVSMGLNGARRCLRVLENVRTILGVLALACYQSAHVLGPERLSPAGQEWFDGISGCVPVQDETRPIHQLLRDARNYGVTGDGARLARKWAPLALAK